MGEKWRVGTGPGQDCRKRAVSGRDLRLSTNVGIIVLARHLENHVSDEEDNQGNRIFIG
jgi:hypothetical protein